MKKLGLVMLIVGVLIMGYTAVKFVKQKKEGSEERVQSEPLPFPWMPTAGALLTAGGIILMGSGRFRKVR